MTTVPPENAEEPDSLDHLLQSLAQYRSLFGEELRASELKGAWYSLSETDPRVITHMSMRLAYLSAKASTECLADLGTHNELMVKLLESQLRTEKLLRHLVSLADDGVGELELMRRVWDETPDQEPELPIEAGGNVSDAPTAATGEPA